MSGDPPSAIPGSAFTLQFPPELPISARVRDITAAIAAHQVVIVAGATGSGKTTQLPKIALAMGRGRPKQIGVTQPRRIAATSVAARVAKELGTALGADVGYQIRFEDRSSATTAVKFMTDGVLLAQIHSDPLLRRYDTLIIDEAHERSLTIDFLLGWLERVLPKRPDLKVIVSSATLETERFSQFFGGAPVIQVEGRTYPVDVLYEAPPNDMDLADAVADAVSEVVHLDPHGDVLVFLPGEREIRESENALNARDLRGAVVQPLYGRLSGEEQSRVFATISQRRVILATNVAETSVTIPGIVYVIDTGIARLSRYDARSGTTRLQIEAISQASADQRKGRCGRVRDGICIRLYDEDSFAARPAFTDPEIKRTGLAGVILRMKSLGLGDVEDYPFLDPPQSRSIAEGYRVLEELGAITVTDHALTPLGKQLARFPVDPRIARMILAGAEFGCLDQVLIIAAALNLQDPRERPRDAIQRADELHRRFRDERSDFVGLLKLWEFVREADAKGTSHLRRTCRDNFLSFLRVREWKDLQRQLQDIVRELRLPNPAAAPSVGDPLHLALLSGLLSRIGQWHPEQRIYNGAKQTRFAIHPASALSRKPPAWVMAYELVETTQLFARTVAKIEPEWLLEVAKHLLKRSHSDPHWSERSARAVVKENATLFGLQVFKDRNVNYESLNQPQARLMFLDHALVRGEFKSRGLFQEKNRQTLERVAKLRDKARRGEVLADEEALLSFFDERVPGDIADGRAFEAWREEAEAKNPKLLVLTMKDALVSDPGLSPEDYPDAITLQGVSCPVTYKFDYAAEDDGITMTVPLVLLAQLVPGQLDWTIPGWHREKIIALLSQGTRAQRKALGSIPELADTLAQELEPFRGAMIPTLARAASELCNADVTEESMRADAVVPYLRTTVRVIDEKGKIMAQGRDVDSLIERFGARARTAWKSAAPASDWERKGFTAWTFGELPPSVRQRVGGIDALSYPALVDRGSSVDLTLLETESAAESATRAGVRRLLMLAARGPVTLAGARLPAPFPKLDRGPVSRSEADAFNGRVLARVVDDAFELAPGEELPRTKTDFDTLLREGAPRIESTSRLYADVFKNVGVELTKTLSALELASKHPSGTTALKEIRAQLAHLFAADLLETVPLARLVHYPRYLRAAQARLERAINDPQKDAGKYAPFAPLWTAFLAKRDGARDQEAAWELRWDFEELRVAIFAPELKTPTPVSLAKVTTAVAALR